MSWRPQLRFYEERVPLLRGFEDAKVLKAFAVGPNRIGARVLDAGHQITVVQDGLSVDLFGPDVDWEEVRSLIDQAVGRIRPERFSGLSARFAHIMPTAASFQEAVAHSVGHVAPASASAVSCSDFAFLIDLATRDGTSAQVEYGVIRSAEARPRLRGLSTRVAPVSAAMKEQRWEAAKFPEVSLFADSFWREDPQREHHQIQEAWDFWAEVAKYASDFVESLPRPDSEQEGRDLA